jgi:hypothetical protein
MVFYQHNWLWSHSTVLKVGGNMVKNVQAASFFSSANPIMNLPNMEKSIVILSQTKKMPAPLTEL